MQMSSDAHPNYVPDSSYGLFIDKQWVAGESGGNRADVGEHLP
ncbi:hypothetical protein M2318_004505 [Metapseudomonas resinovorans]